MFDRKRWKMKKKRQGEEKDHHCGGKFIIMGQALGAMGCAKTLS